MKGNTTLILSGESIREALSEYVTRHLNNTAINVHSWKSETVYGSELANVTVSYEERQPTMSSVPVIV